MDRSGNQIVFSEAEQSKFGVDAEVSVASALSTAEVFKAVAGRLDDRAKALHDKSNHDVVASSEKLCARAGELSTFAVGIERLCAPEIDAEFLRQLNISA